MRLFHANRAWRVPVLSYLTLVLSTHWLLWASKFIQTWRSKSCECQRGGNRWVCSAKLMPYWFVIAPTGFGSIRKEPRCLMYGRAKHYPCISVFPKWRIHFISEHG